MRPSTMLGRHHPFRWRPFTRFVAVADALVLGFVVGILLGYGRLGPVGSNASEGFAVLLFLAVAFAIVANVALGLAWVLTGVMTRRHRPEGQPTVDGSGSRFRLRSSPAPS